MLLHRRVSPFVLRLMCLALCFALVVPQTALAGTRRWKPTPTASSSLAVLFPAAAPEVRHGVRREGELLVRFRPEAAGEEVEALVRSKGAARKQRLRGRSRVERLALAPGQSPEQAAAELRLDPRVEFAEPNFVIRGEQIQPDDPRLSEQWALSNTGDAGQTTGADLNASHAWQVTTGSPETVVAVVDSGVDFSHKDLANNRWRNAGELLNGRDDDRNGYANDLHGWDWVDGTGDVTDAQGHGTAVAGLIAAEGNNAEGVTGVMWRASLMSLRVLDSARGGNVADAVEAIDYAVAKGARVINCSWGTAEESRALREAIGRAAEAGVVVVASAGNGGRDNDARGYYPASYDLPNVIAVAATDSSARLAGWSNHGAARVHVAAPGVRILSTAKGGGYEAVDGTSASAALVSGVAGLIKTLRPALKPERVRESVVRTARSASGLEGQVASGGVVDAAGALAAVTGWPQGPDFEMADGTNSPGGEDPNAGGEGNGNGNGNGQGRGGSGGAGGGRNDRPEPPARSGKFRKSQPNLDELRRRQHSDPLRAATPIPSTRPDYVRGEPVRQPGGTISADFVSTGRYTGGTLSVAHLDPSNRTGTGGEDLFSGNYNWTLPLVSLPGRSGLDLGLSLSYNSLVWTKLGHASIFFDEDRGFPSPGFRLGFPVVQAQFYNETTGKYAFVLVTPTGARVELRQTAAGSNVYEAADSSYLQLIDYGATKLVRSSDGTQLSYAADGTGQFRCTQVKDRNGNFLSVTYNAGRITSVTDTLGRVINFGYDGNNRLINITQVRGASAYTWATFGYTNVYLSPSFPGMWVYGPNNTTLSLLTHVWTNDSALHQFTYNPFGQVYRVERKAPSGALLSQTTYNLPTTSMAHSDCPRFTQRRDWVAEWNGDDGGTYSASEEAVTSFGAEAGDVQTVTLPDGTVVKEFNHTSGWQRGLTYKTETWSGGARKKWTTLDWTQDNTGLSYRQNPRVYETNVWDAEGNRRRRTTVDYHASFGLPWQVTEYAADGATPLRHTHLDYKTEAAYIDRRVIGLLYQKQVFDGAYNPHSREVYGYDWAGELFVDTPQPATQHDRANYGPSFVTGRGNLQHIIRMDVNDSGNSGKWQETKFRYDTVGALRAARDHDWHESSFGYSDSFSDGVARNTFAYRTAATDPGGHTSTAKYDFHTGAVVRTQDPKGAVREMQYDAVGRLEKVMTPFDGAFTQWSYPGSSAYVQQFSTVNSAVAESYSIKMLDGAGRVVSAATGHPYSQGGYKAQHFTFDVMGRMTSQTNPGEIDGWWNPVGDDAGGWLTTTQTYDWQGRPRVTTNTDLTTREVTYEGCGCAGSQVVTTTDEVGRKRRATYDVLGRLWKSEVLNTDGSVYRTVTNTYNALDQITQVADAAAGGATQITTMTYDGHGRLLTRKHPHESAATTYTYKRDDRPESVTDGRGVTNTFAFNTRHLLTGVTFGTATGVASTPNVTYEYDEAGNRTRMVEVGQGQTDYAYNTISQLTSETRQFAGLPNSYQLTYTYNLAGLLRSVTDPANATTHYNYDSEGRAHSVTGSGTVYAGVATYASAVKYRAWGAVKSLTYGNNMWVSANYNARMRLSRYELGGSASPSAPTVMHSDYIYDPDGSLRFASVGSASDGSVNAYDRAYKYDHAGRLVEAFTSQQANDYNANGTVGVGGGQFIPYRQTYQYDAWGNQKYRDNWYWERQDIHTANFGDNRRTDLGWHYDGAGNLVQNPDVAMNYDGAGRRRTLTGLDSSVSRVITQWHDGAGRVVKQLEEGTDKPSPSPVYFLRSTVLGGATVSELDGAGAQTKSKVYLGAKLLAERGQSGGVGWVEWKHESPTTGRRGTSDTGGYYLQDWAEVDPKGIAIGPPTLLYPGEGLPDEGQPVALYGEGMPGGQCSIDGFATDCAEVAQRAANGSAVFEVTFNSGRREQVRPRDIGLGYVPSAVFVDEWVDRAEGAPLTIIEEEPEVGVEEEPSVGYEMTVISRNVGKWHDTGFSFILTGSRRQGPQRNVPAPILEKACQRMAEMMQEIANQANSAENFLDQIARAFLGAEDSSVATLRSSNPLRADQEFNDSGFKLKFQEPNLRFPWNNQVRHFTAGFLVGARFGLPGLIEMNRREEPNTNGSNDPDIALNGESTDMGAHFLGHAAPLEFIRARLASEIKRRICEP